LATAFEQMKSAATDLVFKAKTADFPFDAGDGASDNAAIRSDLCAENTVDPSLGGGIEGAVLNGHA
jgi:hypothetical protein